MSEVYDWYSVVASDDFLSQGDFLQNMPVIIPPNNIKPGKQVEAYVQKYDVIIMSQSCEIQNEKLDFVMLCPFWPLSEIEKENDFFKSDKGKESLRRGYLPGYHLLNKCDIENFKTEYLVVDFKNVYSISYTFLKEFSKNQGNRLRLLPPYREHLSQAFARFFMRVGLSVDIPQFR